MKFPALPRDTRVPARRAQKIPLFTLSELKKKQNFIMYFSLFLFIFFPIFGVSWTNEYCEINDRENCGKNNEKIGKFEGLDEKWRNFVEIIQMAEENYVPCELKKCGCFNTVIGKDLRPFKDKGIAEELIELSKSRGVIYQIINGKLYRSKECMFPSRCAGIEHFVLKIIGNLTDTEFVLNTRDYPQSSKHFGGAMPIFSFSKTPDYYDIMYPAWSFWEGGPAISLYPRGLGRWDQHRLSLNKANEKFPWEKKKSQAFFRGSRTSSERDNLVLLSRKKPELVDAQYTKNQAWKSDEDTLHQSPAPEVSLEDHCQYKYLFNYRGVAASFRHKHLFLCNSLVFHVGDEWIEFYYDSMKPWIHYIPVANDASQKELEQLITFTRENDNLSRKIAERGRNFVWNKLRMSDITCYWKKLLQRYTKLLKYKPVLRKDLIHIGKR